MSIACRVIKLSPRLGRTTASCSSPVVACRSYSDKPEPPSNRVGTLKEERFRVRRARPIDTPRVLRFVKEHSAIAWPGIATHHSQNVVLDDLVSRTLAQGHSMVAEQQDSKRGGPIRGVALSTTVSPWDAALLKTWARCVPCVRSRRLVLFAAHCLNAPALHDKYKVHTVLQVVVIVPPDAKAPEITRLLVKNALQRGRDTGVPVVRFDVTTEYVEKGLSDFHLNKEWVFRYEIHANAIKEVVETDSLNLSREEMAASSHADLQRNQVIVYTAFPLRKL